MKLYCQHRDAIKTGDVIAFSGNSLVSRLIKWKTGSPYSHVGIVMDGDIKGGIGKVVLMVESTVTVKPDASARKVINGVQLHFLSKKLECYDGGAWWLPLKELLPHYAAFSMQQWLREKRADRVPYDFIQALGAGVEMFDLIPGFESQPDFSSLFCSELVTKALQIAGVVGDSINASEQTPADVAAFGCFNGAVRIK